MSNKVFHINDCEWWVINGTREELIDYYNKNVDELDEEAIKEIEECDIEADGGWYEKIINEDDKEKLSGNKEWRKVTGQTNFGDLKMWGGTLFEYTSFKDQIGDEEVTEPYCIACTEY